MYAMTAAHKLLPLGTKVRVTHLGNGRSIVVRVNDRGPFVGNRIIDLSYGGAQKLGMIGTGTARVRVEALEGVGGARPGDMEGRFYIQIAALSNESSAQALVRRLRGRNLGGRAFYAPSIGLWRVQAGPFPSLNHCGKPFRRARPPVSRQFRRGGLNPRGLQGRVPGDKKRWRWGVAP